MPRVGLKTVSVYVTETQAEILRLAAEKRNRSLSNYLLDLGLTDAKELGIPEKQKPKSKRPA